MAGDVISGVALDYVGMVVPAKLGDSWLNGGQIIRTFGQYLIEFCRQSDAASDVI